MPFLWFAENGRWAVMPLGTAAVSLADEREAPAPPEGPGGPVLVRVSTGGSKVGAISPPEGGAGQRGADAGHQDRGAWG